MKRLTIRLQDELHRELRHYAVEQRESVQQIVERAIRQVLPRKFVIHINKPKPAGPSNFQVRFVDKSKPTTKKEAR